MLIQDGVLHGSHDVVNSVIQAAHFYMPPGASAVSLAQSEQHHNDKNHGDENRHRLREKQPIFSHEFQLGALRSDNWQSTDATTI